ncbi:MAG: Uncharacterised protein [Pseudidiomarina mangrovi]|nr:MAG: Uncharacterised protein [Pseudidiomarina mangrovi]
MNLLGEVTHGAVQLATEGKAEQHNQKGAFDNGVTNNEI